MTVAVLAERAGAHLTEIEKSQIDAEIYGTGFLLSGHRIDPKEVTVILRDTKTTERKECAKFGSEIRLSLPYPVSANRYWLPINVRPRGDSKTGKVRQIFVLSTEAKAYKQELAWRAREAGIRKPIVGRVEVDIYLYPARPKDYAKRMKKSPDNWDDDVRSIDLDNANKVLFDAMKGHIIDDDKWVWKITSQRMEPDGEARVVVVIRKIERSSQQGSLI